MLSSMKADIVDKVKRINLLFDMMKEAQEKALWTPSFYPTK